MRLDSVEVVNQFRENIETVRTNKRIFLKSLAVDADITTRQLRRFIDGEQDITMMRADKIAAALGYTLSGLMQWRP
jgi:plasmid maintenance system antidote protein VapI